MGQRLDIYDRFPSGMEAYLSQYGWHFSKKMCDWAVSCMKVENKSTGKKERIEPISKEQLDELLKNIISSWIRMPGTTACTWQIWRKQTITRVRLPMKRIWRCL